MPHGRDHRPNEDRSLNVPRLRKSASSRKAVKTKDSMRVLSERILVGVSTQ